MSLQLRPRSCNKPARPSVFRRNNPSDFMAARFILFPPLLFFFFCPNINAQNYLTLTGKIIDEKSGEAISFAHVGIPEKGIGTTTGFDGGFQLKIPKANENSMLTVSYMGYESYGEKVRDFASGSTIKLAASVGRLTEIVVMDKSAVVDIIRRAVRNIPKNYPAENSNLLAFYRESLTDGSLRYRYLAEGVLRVFKYSYKNRKSGQVGLVQGRKINLRNPLDTSFYSGLSSGHMAPHRFDFVKYREDFLDEGYFPVYDYWMESTTTYNGRPVYVIAFEKGGAEFAEGKKKKRSLADRLLGKNKSSGDGRLRARLKGKVYIEQESYAIIRAEFEVTEDGLRKYDDYPLYVGNWAANRYTVNYRQHEGKWYLSDALREGINSNGTHYTNDVKITEILPGGGNQIPYLERLHQGEQFVRLTGEYDDGFWKNYNTTPMSEGLAESVAQFKNMQKAQEVFSEEYRLKLQRQRDSIATAELMKAKEEMAAEGEISRVEMEDVDFIPPQLRKIQTVKKRFDRVKFSMGLGVHLLETGRPTPLTISYLDGDGREILSLTDDIFQQGFEVIGRWEFDVFLKRNWFLRFGNAFDFHTNVYKDWSVGTGLQMNLRPRHRPIFLRAAAQYSYLKYYRKVGNAENDYGKFKVRRKKFKGDEVRLSYGSRHHNLNLSAEMAIELNPGRELYFRGTYHYTFAHAQDVWFKETKQFHRKDRKLPVGHERLFVTENDAPFDEPIAPLESFSVTVGLMWK